MKLVRIETSRGAKRLVPLTDLELQVTADGYIRAQSSFGPCLEKMLPFYQAVEINGGKFPVYEDEP